MTNRKASILDRASFGPAPPVDLGGPSSRDQKPQRISTTPVRGGPSPAPSHKAQPNRQVEGAHAHPRLSLRKRLAVLLAVIAVPAMAAPGDFGAIAGDAPSEPASNEVSERVETAMAFERPGMSFPGSAFFYLADPPKAALVALPDSNPLESGAQGGRRLGSLIDAGPAARAFAAGTGSNLTRAQDCLAKAVWYEAASESEAGQRAVAQVVLNRVAHPSWPSSVCGVVYEGSERSTGCQFSFTCDGSLSRKARGASWTRAQQIAREALGGSVYAPIGHATHYHTLWVNPYWAKSLDHIGTIGAHLFYRNRGSSGQKDAFLASYSGVEPALAGSASDSVARGSAERVPARSTPAGPASADLAPILEPVATPAITALPALSENLADPALGKAGQTREEFATAEQWKVDPSQLDLSPSKNEPASIKE